MKDDDKQQTQDEPQRRKFLTTSSKALMAAGLAGGYGAFAAVAGRFLYPATSSERRWVFVAEEQGLSVGESLLFRGPSGEEVNVTRQARNGGAEDFVALSSTCPHLGCQVNWEPQNERYFCPCHNGTFDPQGIGTGGPPGDAGQSLPRYDLKIENGMLFMSVSMTSLIADQGDGEVIDPGERISGPGHDPCLGCGPRKS
jgi:Rieske Fe-S protein